MARLRKIFKIYLRADPGATAIEYGLIAALISMAIAFSVFAFGDSLRVLFYDGLGAVLASL